VLDDGNHSLHVAVANISGTGKDKSQEPVYASSKVCSRSGFFGRGKLQPLPQNDSTGKTVVRNDTIPGNKWGSPGMTQCTTVKFI